MKMGKTIFSRCFGTKRNSDEKETMSKQRRKRYQQMKGPPKKRKNITKKQDHNIVKKRRLNSHDKFGLCSKPDFVDWTKRAPKVDMRGKQQVTMQDFELLKVLGTGGYGKVFLTRKTSGADAGTLYALKQTDKSNFLHNHRTVLNAVVERRVLEYVRDSPFMVTLHYAFQTNSTLNLVLGNLTTNVRERLSYGRCIRSRKLFEKKNPLKFGEGPPMWRDFVNSGDFHSYLHRTRRSCRFEENEARFYIAELVLALESLHTMGIIYRDLKPENILLDAEGHIVLADFGLCKEFEPGTQVYKARSYLGTDEYIAPEISIAQDSDYDFTADWWSLGVVTYELMVGLVPFYSRRRRSCTTSEDVKNLILTSEPKYPDFLSPSAKHFIGCLLTKDPRHRLGANGVQEVKSHPFFMGVSWDILAQKCYTVPYKPDISHPEDVSYFDEEFTSMPLTSSTDMAPSKGLLLGTDYSFVDPSIPLEEDTTSCSTLSLSSSRQLLLF